MGDERKIQEKPPRKRWPIVLGVSAAVVIAVGAGFFAWHQSPSFCSAICHSPMDPYVESYNSDDASLLVTAHRDNGDTCLDCHEPGLDQQISEAQAWLAGDFDDPMKVRRFGTAEFCFRCHDDGDPDNGTDWAQIQEATAGYQGTARNPHDSHQGMLECYSCHFMHDDSTMYCQKCHSDIAMPEEWR